MFSHKSAAIFVLIYFFLSVCIADPEKDDCVEYSTPFENRVAQKLAASSVKSFTPLKFRANNYGSVKYKMQLDTGPIFRLTILLEDGERPDTLKGGDLGGTYVFDNSVITLKKNGNANTTSLELWNLYVLKSDSAERDKQSDGAVALQISFQENDTWNPALNPIFKVLSKLNRNRTAVRLPYNFDLYALLPRETGFAVYETNTFPFEFPAYYSTSEQIISKPPPPQDGAANSSIQRSQCGPIIMTYFFTEKVLISREQWNYLDAVAQKLEKTVQVPAPTAHVQSQNTGHVSYVANKQHLIFRRMIVEAHSLEGLGPVDPPDDDEDSSEDDDEEEYYEDDDPLFANQQPIVPQDEELYPSDCAILYKAIAEFEGRIAEDNKKEIDSGSEVTLGSLGLTLPFLLIIFSI